MRARLVLVLPLLTTLAAAGPARAAGPPLIGGESRTVYTAALPHRGEVTVKLDAGTDRVWWIFVNSKKTTKCTRGRDDGVHLYNTPFRVGPTRHAVRWIRNVGKTRGGYERFDLRFNADWSRLTLKIRSRFVHNALGRCREDFQRTIRRAPAKHPWMMGRYAGTTSQGLPIAFATGFEGLTISFFVKNLTTTVQAPCTDGQTGSWDVQPTADDPNPMVDDMSGGFGTRLTPGGTTDVDQGWAEISGTLTGSTASGSIRVQLRTPAGDLCEAQVTFTVQRQ